MDSLPYLVPSSHPDSDDKIPRDPPMCLRMMNPPASNGFGEVLYNVVLALPALLSLLFLLTRLRLSVRKLLQSRSHIMRTYYSFLWVICVLNLCWCLLEMQQARNHDKETAWNVMSLVTRFGLVLLEVSVVVFLSQGYLVSGWDALLRTLLFSGIFATADALVKAIYIFGFGIPLFTTQDDAGDWHKWGFWLLHNLFFCGSVCCDPNPPLYEMERSTTGKTVLLSLRHDLIPSEWVRRLWKFALGIWCQFWILCLRVRWFCILRSLPASLVYYFPFGFPSRGRHANGGSILRRDEGCRLLRW